MPGRWVPGRGVDGFGVGVGVGFSVGCIVAGVVTAARKHILFADSINYEDFCTVFLKRQIGEKEDKYQRIGALTISD